MAAAVGSYWGGASCPTTPSIIIWPPHRPKCNFSPLLIRVRHRKLSLRRCRFRRRWSTKNNKSASFPTQKPLDTRTEKVMRDRNRTGVVSWYRRRGWICLRIWRAVSPPWSNRTRLPRTTHYRPRTQTSRTPNPVRFRATLTTPHPPRTAMPTAPSSLLSSRIPDASIKRKWVLRRRRAEEEGNITMGCKKM